MRRRLSFILAAVIAAIILAACTSTGQLDPAAQNAVTILCAADGLAQPIAVQLAPALAPQITPLASVDQALVHPAVVNACTQALAGSKPVAVASTPPAAVAPAK